MRPPRERGSRLISGATDFALPSNLPSTLPQESSQRILPSSEGQGIFNGESCETWEDPWVSGIYGIILLSLTSEEIYSPSP